MSRRNEGQPLSLRQTAVLAVRAVGVMLTAGVAYEGVSAAQAAAISPNTEMARVAGIPQGPNIVQELTEEGCKFRRARGRNGTIEGSTLGVISQRKDYSPELLGSERITYRFTDSSGNISIVDANFKPGETRVTGVWRDKDGNPAGSRLSVNGVRADTEKEYRCQDGTTIVVDAVTFTTEVEKDGAYERTTPDTFVLGGDRINEDDYKSRTEKLATPTPEATATQTSTPTGIPTPIVPPVQAPAQAPERLIPTLGPISTRQVPPLNP